MRRRAKASSLGFIDRLSSGRAQRPPVAIAAGSLIVLCLLFAAAPALALPQRPFLENLGAANEPAFTAPKATAVDPSSGDVLVIDNGAIPPTLSRFHEDGSPANFSALNNTNVIDGLAGEPDEVPFGEINFGFAASAMQIAVDDSGGATDGNIYLTTAVGAIYVFASSGEFRGEVNHYKEGPTAAGTEKEYLVACGVAVDSSGDLFVAESEGGLIHRYEPSAALPVPADNTANFSVTQPCALAAGSGPSAGFIFATEAPEEPGSSNQVLKLDAQTGALQYAVSSVPTTTIGVDPQSGNLYAARGEEFVAFNVAGPTEAAEVSATELASAAKGIAVNGATGNVYVTREGFGKVEVFAGSGFHPLENLGAANEPSFTAPKATAVDPSNGDVLVIDNEATPPTLSRFHEDGSPDNFSALNNTNAIDGLAGEPDEVPFGEINFGFAASAMQIAVDDSGTATDGNIYLTTAVGAIYVFASSGEFRGEVNHYNEGPTAAGPEKEYLVACGVAVDPSGDLFVAESEGGLIHRYEPSAALPAPADNTANFSVTQPCALAAGSGPSAGFLFATEAPEEPGSSNRVLKLNAQTGALQYAVSSVPTTTIGVDPKSGNLYAARGEEFAEFNVAGPTAAAEVSATELTSAAKGIAVNATTGNVYATREGFGKVEVFAPGPASKTKFPLTIVKSGGGSGTVTSAPSGIDCGSTCAAEFEEGKLVHLTAAASPDSKFSGWSAITGNPGTCIGTTSPCDVTMSAAIELKAQFELRPPPVVLSLNPSQGPTAGANTVAIEGSGLANASTVAFGFGSSVDDAEFIQNTDSLIEVKAPGHAAGAVHVIVTTGAGPSSQTLADEYTFVAPPAVTAISPAKGPIGGGNQVQITGLRLNGATAIRFGDTTIQAPFTEDSATKILLNAPAHEVGKVDVRVITIGGTSPNFVNDDYTYELPTPPPPNPPTTTTSPILSPPPPPPGCLVPKLKSLTLAKAKSALSKAHCAAGEVRKPRKGKGKGAGPLIVKSSKPAAKTSLPANSEIDLVLGPKPKSRKGGSK